ncbi:MAG: late competence development ComFB family protein [Spirochaetes bacterium]|nr:late competence development ComFB family protein [Spirochaetota bacterium]
MAIKNMIEDIVSSTIEEVLDKNEDFDNLKSSFQEIMAFVLNRIPPKYVTSERGILHTEIDSKFMFQQKSDILFLIYEAIDVIKNRRETAIAAEKSDDKGHKLYFPHLIGQVVEESTFSPVSEVKISLLNKGNPVKMMDESWKNPYVTNKSTKGYYHFWPIFDENCEIEKNSVVFEITFEHADFKEKSIKISLPVEVGYNLSRSKAVPLTLITLINPDEVTFLYE